MDGILPLASQSLRFGKFCRLLKFRVCFGVQCLGFGVTLSIPKL